MAITVTRILVSFCTMEPHTTARCRKISQISEALIKTSAMMAAFAKTGETDS